jgi:hypothetical protein
MHTTNPGSYDTGKGLGIQATLFWCSVVALLPVFAIVYLVASVLGLDSPVMLLTLLVGTLYCWFRCCYAREQ